MSGARLQVATTLADLPADVTAAPPDLIFLQNRLSGLSAEILSRHIRNQLSSAENVTIVILAESPGDAPDEATVGTSVCDEDLLVSLRQVITVNCQRDIPGPPPAGAPVPSAREEEISYGGSQTIAEPEDAALGDTSFPGDFVNVSLVSRPADGTAGTGTAPPHPPPLNFREELESLTGPSLAETATGHASSPLPQSAPPIGRRSNVLRWSIVAIATIAVGTILFLATRGTQPPAVPQHQQALSEKTPAGITDTPAATGKGQKELTASTPSMPALEPSSPAPPTKGARKTSLPTFIPAASMVPGYNNRNPGWEQYVTPEFEARIFRKGRDIDALQVIDKTGKGISRSFFTRTILEMADVRDYRLQSKEIRGDYLIKRGALSADAGVILYKKKDDTQLRAFVIHYH